MALYTGWTKHVHSLGKEEYVLNDLLQTFLGIYCKNRNSSNPVLSVIMAGEINKIGRPRRRKSSFLNHEFI